MAPILPVNQPPLIQPIIPVVQPVGLPDVQVVHPAIIAPPFNLVNPNVIHEDNDANQVAERPGRHIQQNQAVQPAVVPLNNSGSNLAPTGPVNVTTTTPIIPQRRSNRIPHRNEFFNQHSSLISFTEDELELALTVGATLSHPGPKNYNEAVSSPASAAVWMPSMQAEINALNANGTWSLVPLPPGKKVVGSTWVLRTKRNSDGSIVKRKSRLVAQGFTQIHGLNFDETFSPVARFTT